MRYPLGGAWGVLSIMAYRGRLWPKGVPFLSKMVFKKVRGWTLRQSLPVSKILLSTTTPMGLDVIHGARLFLLFSSLSKDVFERRSSTGSLLLHSLAVAFPTFLRKKELSNINLLASKHIEREKASLLVDVRRTKTSFTGLSVFN